MPKVWNMRDPNKPATAIYIGRAVPSQGIKKSIWGNPFRLPRHTNPFDDAQARLECVVAYEHWLLHNESSPLGSIGALRGKDLVCWCAPLPCHGDVLLKWANKDIPQVTSLDAPAIREGRVW